jgi:hypothetical protein
MIDRKACLEALEKLTNINSADKRNYKDLCDRGLSIASLFRLEIPKKGNCTLAEANEYIREEESQMEKHVGHYYDMDHLGVAEHVYAEQNLEPEHAHSLYSPTPGDVKFFEEWLEGHHPSLGCIYNMRDQVPPDEYYRQLAESRVEASSYREGKINMPLGFMPITRRG